mgnify:CR=1 FL=1
MRVHPFPDRPLLVPCSLEGLDHTTQRCRGRVQAILSRHYPDRKEAIEAAVLDESHASWSDLRRDLAEAKEQRGLDLRIRLPGAGERQPA